MRLRDQKDYVTVEATIRYRVPKSNPQLCGRAQAFVAKPGSRKENFAPLFAECSTSAGTFEVIDAHLIESDNDR